jgi:hypothetical protein
MSEDNPTDNADAAADASSNNNADNNTGDNNPPANSNASNSPAEADLPVDRDRTTTAQDQKMMAEVAAGIDAGGGEIPEIMCVNDGAFHAAEKVDQRKPRVWEGFKVDQEAGEEEEDGKRGSKRKGSKDSKASRESDRPKSPEETGQLFHEGRSSKDAPWNKEKHNLKHVS